MSGKGKGSGFERDICRQLSLWWSDGKDDDIFWRTASSGGRATQRNKKGKKTFGQAGDVQATNPIGQPLIDVCAIELKRGYSKTSVFDIVDKPTKAKEQMYEAFFRQAIQSHKSAGSYSWMLITRRDRREAVVFIPLNLYKELKLAKDTVILFFPPYTKMTYKIKGLPLLQIVVTPLKNFLRSVCPENIKDIVP